MNVRELTLKLLCDYEENGKYVNLSLNSHLLDRLSAEDRSFLTALLYTTVERKITLDYWIGALAARSPDDLSVHTRAVLRMGLCQLCFFEKIPPYAAVNETVKLAANPGERALVNGVLRHAASAKEQLPLPDRQKNAARYLSVCYSFPLWIVKYFIRSYGESSCEMLLQAFDKPAPLTVAVNTLRISRDALLERFRSMGIDAEPTAVADGGIRVRSAMPVRNLYGFSDGLFYVQDEASQIQSLVLAPEPGHCVADVCAAPGGKSFAAAIRMEGRGEIHSFDLHEGKIPLITDGASRLGIRIIRASSRSALSPDPALLGKMDRVICDVPCSGLGVMGKKPDLRYKDISCIQQLAETGYSILERSLGYLKRGGILVYSTCTLTEEENQAVVRRLLREHPEMELVPFSIGDRNAADGTLTLLPHVDGTDGFFLAKFRHRTTDC